jgi:hypothetical protein
MAYFDGSNTVKKQESRLNGRAIAAVSGEVRHSARRPGFSVRKIYQRAWPNATTDFLGHLYIKKQYCGFFTIC